MFYFIFSSPGRSPGRAIVLPPALASALASASASAAAAASALAKSLTLKFFMCWARRCQASYPVPVTGLVTLLHSEQPKLHRVLAMLSAIGLKENHWIILVSLILFSLFRYEVFHKEQTQIVKQYPDMVKQELRNYDEAVCQLFAVDRNNPVSLLPGISR